MVELTRLEVLRDDISSSDSMAIQKRNDLDRVRTLERLAGVVNKHPVRTPVVLRGLKRPTILTDLHALNVARAAEVLDSEREPVVAGARVHFQRHVLVRVRARHALVENVVEADVAKRAVLAGVGHCADGRAAEVEGRFVPAAVGSSWAKVGDYDASWSGLATWV